jgi:hypothetical protein
VGGTLVRAIHSQGLAPQPADFWRQAGCGCLVLTACAMMSARIRRLPHALGIIAGESLTVYCLHLAIVYGSPWNAGLRQLIGPTLDLRSVIAVVLLMWSTMAGLVIGWGVCKRQHPIVAARIRYVVAASLALGLLL